MASPYGVEALRTPNREDALTKKEEMLNSGYAPVDIYQDGVMYQVIIGKYDDVLTPKLIQEKIKERGISSNVLSLSGKTPIPELFSGKYLPNLIFDSDKYICIKNAAMIDSTFVETRSEAQEFDQMMKTSSIPELESYVKNILDTKPLDDPIRGWALLKNGYLQYKKNNKESMKESFLIIAERKVAVTKKHSCEALMRLGLAAAGEKKKLESYQLFEELKNQTDSNTMKAFAQAQQAGIIMEVARGAEEGGGALEDCRNACMKVLAYTTPEEAKQTCATAELMYFETFYYEGKYEEAVDLGWDFISKYADQTREVSMALHFLGISIDKVGNYQEALEVLKRTFDMDFSQKGTAFGQNGVPFDMKAKAAEWIKYLSYKNNDDTIIEEMKQLYPEYFTNAR
jgi:tetratricopeptide (TPR) repeat protein